MIDDVLIAVWFYLPAAAANMAPVFAAKLPLLAKLTAPLDGGATVNGHRVLGDNKTWRGLIAGVIVAIFVVWIQQRMVSGSDQLAQVFSGLGYATLPVVLTGILFGVGALGGDALESLIKRARGIAPGTPWIPYDQIDHIIGACLLVSLVITLSLAQYIWLGVIWCGLHFVANYVGWRLGLKDDPL